MVGINHSLLHPFKLEHILIDNGGLILIIIFIYGFYILKIIYIEMSLGTWAMWNFSDQGLKSRRVEKKIRKGKDLIKNLIKNLG